MKQLNKKGQSQLLGFIIAIGLSIFVIGGLVIGLAAFQDSQCLAEPCVGENATNTSQFLGSGLTMFDNFGGQLGTIGTLIGVALLIAVIVGAFAVGRVGGGSGGF